MRPWIRRYLVFLGLCPRRATEGQGLAADGWLTSAVFLFFAFGVYNIFIFCVYNIIIFYVYSAVFIIF